MCAILVLAGTQSVSASDGVRRFRFGGLLGAATAHHHDLNETIDDYGDIISPGVGSWQEEEVGGGPVWGFFGEYLATDRFAVGAEFLRLSGNGGFDWSFYEYDYYYEYYMSVREDVVYEASTSAVSIYGVYRLPMRDSPVSLRFGAGIGYLLDAKFEMNVLSRLAYSTWSASEDRQETYVFQADIEASGSGPTFHGLVGAEYQVTDHFLLMANASYRIARVDELEVDAVNAQEDGVPVDWWLDVEEGEILRWYVGEAGAEFSTSEGEEVGLDFGGLQLTVRAAYTF